MPKRNRRSKAAKKVIKPTLLQTVDALHDAALCFAAAPGAVFMLLTLQGLKQQALSAPMAALHALTAISIAMAITGISVILLAGITQRIHLPIVDSEKAADSAYYNTPTYQQAWAARPEGPTTPVPPAPHHQLDKPKRPPTISTHTNLVL